MIGHGRCLFLAPLKSHVSGTLHFRSYGGAEAVEHVPVLTLDRTQYVYAPALSRQCQSASELQLLPSVDLPESLGERSHVRVNGAVEVAVEEHQRTRFVFRVDSIESYKSAAP